MKENFLPIDLVHLRDKAVAIKDNLERSQNPDRSEEFKKKCLQNAINISDTLVRDFDYDFDTKIIGGMIPMGLDKKIVDTMQEYD
jgi:hypothetical protein